ncbi:JmjC domain-containing protein 4, partial [Tetrabaena socialis]
DDRGDRAPPEAAPPEPPAAAYGGDGDGGGGCAAPPLRYRQLPYRHADELSYDDFVLQYMAPNLPVVIRGATAGWRAASEWRSPDGRLQLAALGALAGHCRVCVTDTSDQEEGCGEVESMRLADYLRWWGARGQAREQGLGAEQEEQGMGAGAGLAAGEGASASGAAPSAGASRVVRGDGGGGGGSVGGGGDARQLYLKDWHFAAEFPDYGYYRLPVYFADDWLNEFYDALAAAEGAQLPRSDAAASGPEHDEPSPSATGRGAERAATAPAAAAVSTSDYRFLYLGPAGSWTPLHSDVLRSFSWSANVCGRKRWLLLHPAHTHLLYDRRATRLAPHLEPDRWAGGRTAGPGGGGSGGGGGGGSDDRRRATPYPLPYILAPDRPPVRPSRPPQEAGDAVFVPSGWHHCVENLADTLSLNHNWVNGHNLHWKWALLRRQYADAAAAIDDCRCKLKCVFARIVQIQRELCAADEFEGLSQANLKANAGLDFLSFVELLQCIVVTRAERLRALASRDSGGGASDERSGEGTEAANLLLALQRAGLVLADFCAAFVELVVGPAARRSATGGDDEAVERLEGAACYARARELMAIVEATTPAPLRA